MVRHSTPGTTNLPLQNVRTCTTLPRHLTPEAGTATDSRRTAPGSRSHGTRLPYARHSTPAKMPFLIDAYVGANTSFNHPFNTRVPRWLLIPHPARQRAPLRGNLDCASRTWKTQEHVARQPVAAAHRRSASLLAVSGGGGPGRAILAPSLRVGPRTQIAHADDAAAGRAWLSDVEIWA